MTAALVAALVVAAAALAVAGWRDRAARAAGGAADAQARARAAEAERRAGEAEAEARRWQDEAASAATAAEAASGRALRAEARLAVARQQSETARGALEALWALAVLEGERAWRLTMGQPRHGDGGGRPATLAAAVEGELERIREETGTPGDLIAAVDTEPAPAGAVVALRAVQALLATFTRYGQSYDLELAVGAGEVVATLVCNGFEGPEALADDTSALLAALAPCRATLHVEALPGGRLQARLDLPAPLFPVAGAC